MLPKARTESLIVEELPDETLIYDQRSDKAHCLNGTAMFVWNHCDGKTSVPQLARLLRSELRMPANEEMVWLALEGLSKSRLLENNFSKPEGMGAISRRDLAKRLGLAGGVAVALPLVTSIIAPRAADAASAVPVGAICGPNGPPKGTCIVVNPCPPAVPCAPKNKGSDQSCICGG